jgi:hypothetical protein
MLEGVINGGWYIEWEIEVIIEYNRELGVIREVIIKWDEGVVSLEDKWIREWDKECISIERCSIREIDE